MVKKRSQESPIAESVIGSVERLPSRPFPSGRAVDGKEKEKKEKEIKSGQNETE